MSRRPVNWFEDVVSSGRPHRDAAASRAGRYPSIRRPVPLQPGRYRLNIAAKDVVGGNTTNFEMALDVPRLEDDTLARAR